MSSSILAQCIGMISMTLLFVTYQINDRKKILLCQVCISLCWVVHYGLLGASSAMIINMICVVRNITFSLRGKNRWASSKALPAAICSVQCLASLVCWQGIPDVLTLFGAPLQTAALWMKSPRRIRQFMLMASPLWLIYDACNGSYVGIATESIVMISILSAMIRYDRVKSVQPEQNG
ncbi:MAG: YgjV family protein [Butyricicoccus sp.]